MMVFLLLIGSNWRFIYLSSKGLTASQFTWICFFMGCSVGYWATFVTIASEQFGTNLRATVTTTVPNFVRGALIPINALFAIFQRNYGMINAGYIVMISCLP
jgi:putative MFS transporter